MQAAAKTERQRRQAPRPLRGIEGEAKRCEAIRAAHRTGKGEWYAVVGVSREDRDNPRILEHFLSRM